MALSSKSLCSLQDCIIHTQTQFQKPRLEGRKWFIACFLLDDIPKSNYYWVVHDKEYTKNFEDDVDTVL